MDTTGHPPHLTSRETLTVRFRETDLMGIVHHANYLEYMEIGRVEWLRRRGAAYEDWAKRGVHLPVVEARLQYLKPARFDDRLTIETTCTRARNASARFHQRVLRGDEVLCEAEILLACVGDDLKLRALPEDLTPILRRAEL